MPEVTVACPHCQKPIRVMSEHAGAQVACPFCANAMVVPQMSGGPTPEQIAQQQAAETAARQRAAEEQAARAAAAAAAAQVPVSATNDVHTFGCSHCREPFQVASESLGQAVQCPSCGGAVRLPGPQPSQPPQHPQASVPTPVITDVPEPTPNQPVIVDTGSTRAKKKGSSKRPKQEGKPSSVPIPVEPPTPKADATEPESEPEPEPPKKKEAKRRINPANAPVPLSMGGGAVGQPILSGDGVMGVLDPARLLPPRYPAMVPRMADIALSADGKAVASMSFQEPVKTILVNGQERVLRRLSPEEKIVRRRLRNAVVFVCGILFLLIAGALMVR